MQLMLAQKCAECRPDAFQMQVPTGNQPACVDNRSFRRTSKCFLSLLLCKALIMLGQGKGPKVDAAACKSWSRLPTFPRGAVSQEARHQARKG